MAFVNGRTYRFINRYFSDYALNVYGTNAASTGRNVCLYGDDPTDIMQDWVVKTNGTGYRLHSAVNESFVLDRSDGSLANSYLNNAHLCATAQTSTADSRVEFEKVSDNVYRIYLPAHDLYLTATNINVNANGLPASSISTLTALTGGTGGESNVYWATRSSSAKQEWTVEPEVDGGSEPDPGDDTLTSDVIVSMPDDTYLSQRDSSTWSDFDSSYPVGNFKSSGCSAVAATMMARIMENDDSITTKDLYDWDVWTVQGNFPWANWTQNEYSQLHFTYENPATQGWSTAKGLIFDEIVNDRPVIIYLKNDTLGTSHFVVAYGLKRGASKKNLQYNQIMVYNPDPQGAVWDGTLADMMELNLWKDFGSIRRAFTD